MRKLLVLLVFAGFHQKAGAVNYYVSTTGNDKADGLTVATAWQTLQRVQQAASDTLIKAGDSILFKRGDVFNGTLQWTTIWGQNCPTGTRNHPITLAAYGTGAKPEFHYPKDSDKKPENRILMLFSGVEHIIIDGLHFSDADKTNDKVTPANCGAAIYLGTMDEAVTNNCTIRNVDIDHCGLGVVIIGNYNKVTRCRMADFKNLLSSPKTDEGTQYDDYGANAITITGDENEISYNYIHGAWATSADFGWNGGACEMFNHCNRNQVIHNTIIDCGGLAEFGALRENAFAEDNLFAYNKIINCGSLTWCNISGVFSIRVSNIQYFNNTIVETNDSRFTGPQTGKGIADPEIRKLTEVKEVLFAFNGNPDAATVFNLQQNVFHITTGIPIVKAGVDMSKIKHEKNIYYLAGNDKPGFTPNESEKLVGEKLFSDSLEGDPSKWDLQLIKGMNAHSVGAAANPFTGLLQVAACIAGYRWMADYMLWFLNVSNNKPGVPRLSAVYLQNMTIRLWRWVFV